MINSFSSECNVPPRLLLLLLLFGEKLVYKHSRCLSFHYLFVVMLHNMVHIYKQTNKQTNKQQQSIKHVSILLLLFTSKDNKQTCISV